MIDLTHLEKYKENNRIEAKKAIGGLPDSIWETYSAFANTLGGVILLGVEEQKDKSLHAIDLPDPTYLIEEFWKIINDTNKVSVNILTEKDVQTEIVDGKDIVVIRVPRAERSDKPVYIDGNPLSGTYRRNGEGDYHCTADEVQAMLRDAESRSQDMIVLENMDMGVFDYNSVHRYRQRMRISRPGHVWEELEDEDFLYKLGAVSSGKDGRRYPTIAGLLMFGYEYEIVKEFPHYLLDYQEQFDDSDCRTERIVSSSGDWSGNLYDFYFKVYNRIAQDIKTPLKIKNGERIDDTPVHTALREALANCIINADYHGKQGLVIIKKRDTITFSNPGNFRINIEAAKSGGVSDPRNTTLIKMFNLIDIGEHTGSGIPNIYRVWDKQGWEAPVITEDFEPERITLSLSVISESNTVFDEKAVINPDDKKKIIELQKETVIEHLTDHVTCKSKDIANLLGIELTRSRDLLNELITDGIVVAEGANSNCTYRLREKSTSVYTTHEVTK